MKQVQAVRFGVCGVLLFMVVMYLEAMHIEQPMISIAFLIVFIASAALGAATYREPDYTKAGEHILSWKVKEVVQEKCRRGATITEAEIIAGVRAKLKDSSFTDTDDAIKRQISKTRGLIRLRHGVKEITYRNEIPN